MPLGPAGRGVGGRRDGWPTSGTMPRGEEQGWMLIVGAAAGDGRWCREAKAASGDAGPGAQRGGRAPPHAPPPACATAKVHPAGGGRRHAADQHVTAAARAGAGAGCNVQRAAHSARAGAARGRSRNSGGDGRRAPLPGCACGPTTAAGWAKRAAAAANTPGPHGHARTVCASLAPPSASSASSTSPLLLPPLRLPFSLAAALCCLVSAPLPPPSAPPPTPRRHVRRACHRPRPTRRPRPATV